MKVIFLGTNGWYSTKLGNTVCTLIDSEKHFVVLDAGDGIYKLDKYIKTTKPTSLFISHLHLDHIIGLHALGKLSIKQPLNIYGYKGTIDGLSIINHPYSGPLDDLPYVIYIHDLQEGTHNSPFLFNSKLLVHVDPCLGYRFELDGKVITYCTDTGVCENLYELARNANLLITECSYKPGQKDLRWPHLNPEDSANIALKANVKRLVLTHFDAHQYSTRKERNQAENAAKNFFRRLWLHLMGWFCLSNIFW